MNDLKNKNIIVTGATGGIGNSIVHLFLTIEKLKEVNTLYLMNELFKLNVSLIPLQVGPRTPHILIPFVHLSTADLKP